MATDVIISSGEVSNQSDMNANRTDPESDTPNRTSESPENRNISSAASLSTSSVRTGEEEPHEDSVTGISVANGNRAGDPQQETENTAETPDNRQKQGVRTSTPVRLLHTSAGQHNGSFEHQESVATTEARLRMEGVELKEEWQDEDFPRPLPEEEDIHLDEEFYSGEGAPASQSYGLNSAKKTKRKLLAPEISLNLDHSEGSVLSDELDESTELDLDDIDTPSENSNEFEWEGNLHMLRKNLKSLIIVHPSWFIRTLLALTKPFISSKFSQKIKFVYSLTDLAELVPMEYVSIPDCIKQFDEEKNRKKHKRIDRDMHGKAEIATAAVPE
ncbi:BCL2/adenovirus E1B 19 kDa protein-interacting protein 2 [Danio aesculapii]|uniref:BCL2/adenovirus E1B 19 kDa protein-interacting protein 2 n=1 Tax=Danio aesculapii TaxID=1142201 RepID=UPI0024BF27C0|nr:BCL2/adenovirus E1B 19 kDa protein-interacting protein 2 [Danio aesculapii]